jgi:pre-mRNA branch site protein p14
MGDGPKTKGTAYVAFEEMADAKRALDRLNGFHLQERYIVGECLQDLDPLQIELN